MGRNITQEKRKKSTKTWMEACKNPQVYFKGMKWQHRVTDLRVKKEAYIYIIYDMISMFLSF